MFHHSHPFPPFILENTTRLILGTLPLPRFTTGDLNDEDVDFVMVVATACCGGCGTVSII